MFILTKRREGFQRLLDIPGYDVAALVEKSGKSTSHIYARLSLLQLIPEVAEAFTHERITASHANLIARHPAGVASRSFRAVLAKRLEGRRSPPATRQVPLRLDTEQPLSLTSRCAVRPRRPHPQPRSRSLHHLPPPQRIQHFALFCDVATATSASTENAIKPRSRRTSTARSQPVPTSSRSRTAGGTQRSRGPEPSSAATSARSRTVIENPDAEPASPCAAAKTAIIVYGKRVGTTTTVCTDNNCPVHDPRAAAAQTANPAPTIAPAPEAETEEEAEERQRNYEQQRKEYEEEQERRAEERRQEERAERARV